jgi:Iron-containing redox enzyme
VSLSHGNGQVAVADTDGWEPPLPRPRGPLSGLLLAHLRSSPHQLPEPPAVPGDALGDDDLHLALYVCYELSYRGFSQVDEGWEWHPSLIAYRARLERPFERALRTAHPASLGNRRGVAEELRSIVDSDRSPSLSQVLLDAGTLEQYREFAVHRSAYQLKEADPHTWAIPRLAGVPKATLIRIQSEEYGDGSAERMHCTLFARTMEHLGLDSRYGAYLDLLPGPTLATVNLMSMLGLHRRLRGAIVGHLTVFEMTSSGPNARYAGGLRRLGLGEAATHFYDEHVEADSVHEVMARTQLAATLAAAEPRVADDILLGARALLDLEGRFARRLLDSWADGRSSLRRPLTEPAALSVG